MTKNLIVATDEKIIGTITESNDNFLFEYDTSWIERKESFDLSPKIKRSTITHTGNGIKNFLENLLPEEKIRENIAIENKIDKKDIISLLEISGRDSAGALQLYSPPEFKNLNFDSSKTFDTTIDELSKDIQISGGAINFIKKIGLKPSLSGAQDKIACRYDHEIKTIKFPLASGATTHIIKPASKVKNKEDKALEKSAMNEFITMRLAQKIFNGTPKTYFYESNHRDLFIIERYDRKIINKSNIERIHQFDFCQYLGLSSSEKYEISNQGRTKGEFGIKCILDIIEAESEEILNDKNKVLNWVIFNYLVENTDSHLKNISMISTGTGFKLAPYYDITSVGFYRKLDNLLMFDNYFAFDIGGMSKMNDIGEYHWKVLSKKLGYTESYLLEKIKELSVMISKSIKDVYSDISLEIKNPKNLKDAEKILKYIASSMEEKAIRNLINTKLKSVRTSCEICGKKLTGKKDVLGIGPECLKKLKL